MKGIIDLVKRDGVNLVEDIPSADYGRTPLMVACYYGYAGIVRYLCQHGANVNFQNPGGESALFFASYYNFPGLVKI
jgi:ankyrin repeat protein